MIVCRPKKQYYVTLYKEKKFHDVFGTGWTNFIHTPYINQARYYAKKLKLKHRQIDVREIGKKPYVLKNSWL